ncbi:RNA-binding S4 domain-containing protein [Mycolicibacterium vaccae ATCC 25954]|uniref:RNA-binding S4 domain-containing protein n=2 Tax=Mycolicibacterium vaccae TaxID=1810 RepID=K0UJS3_MYCVA|nr:tRNA synthetase RNA-binding protein [Mycolicibacterium vaccae 95051]EJZ07096.1 RNA-binding S4 domain-containing protein [Mycolicibacterium vaccae ATCC 25954]
MTGMAHPSDEPADVPIRDDSIRLCQFLKLAGLIDSGADAKAVIGDGLVSVNGETDLRRGRQLRPGDVVVCEGRSARVSAGSTPRE